MSERNAWLDWLASSGYGIDYNFDTDPPCTIGQLAAAYVRVTGEEDVDTWVWTIRNSTQAFWRGTRPESMRWATRGRAHE